MNSFSIVIPARYNSSRFPGKPLALINGKTLIELVYEKCLAVCKKDNIFVATDDQRINKFLYNKKIQSILTSKKCLTGTDRVAQASKNIDSEIIINVQGDEPLISPRDIKLIIKAKKKNPDHVICGFNIIKNKKEAKNLNIPKVVMNQKNDLVYISRSLVPGSKSKKSKIVYLRQVCIYAFNKKELTKFYKFKNKPTIEKIEDIELLRFFELDQKIKMIKLSNYSIAVDTKNDLKKIRKLI